MKPDPFILIFLLTLILLLLFFIIFFFIGPLKRKEQISESHNLDAFIGAFNALGDEIKSLKEQLIIKERLAALGEISAGIVHEFRNPMSVIAGYCRLLLKELRENDERREIVQGILREIEEMNCIMEELLKFTKSEPVNKTNIDLTKIVNDVVHSFNERERIFFSYKEPLIVKGDEILLRQAIRNLIQNACDAGDKVWVDIEKVRSEGKIHENSVCISIRDNGKGIPEGDLNRIFMPFYSTKQKGTGIGLALVQKIALGHNGKVTVESKEGIGSTFKLFLPIENV